MSRFAKDFIDNYFSEDYGPYNEYMSKENNDKCDVLIQLLCSAYNNANEEEYVAGGNIAAGFAFREINKHLKICSKCQKHPLLKEEKKNER